MIKSNITGGVSPLKGKRQASRGGKHAGKATATGKRRGGFAKSKGKRGGGGRNVGGYNVQTRFKADKWTPPASGGTTVIPTVKPYSYDKDGKLQVNPQPAKGVDQAKVDKLVDEFFAKHGIETKTTPGTKGTPEEGYWEKYDKNIHQDLESYQAVWDKDESVRTKYDSVEEFAKDADKWWNEQAAAQNTTVAELKKSYKRVKTETGWRWVKTKDATEGTEGSTEVKATTSVGGTTTVGTSGTSGN